MDGKNLADRLAQLSPAKRALLEKKLRESGRDSSTLLAIPRRVERQFAPLSFAQQRLWFIHQVDPTSPAYHEHTALRLTGKLDLDALRSAINHIVMRHEVLRTNFVLVDGNPMQKILDSQTVEIRCVDLRSYALEIRESEANLLMRETLRRPFDLGGDVLLRPLLIRLDDLEQVLLIVRHHIASDGWSSSIFRRELSILYDAFANCGEPSLAELPIQYADYAVWQRQHLSGEVLEAQLAYWREQLAGVPALNLPTDRPRPIVQSSESGKESLVLPRSVTDQLRALSGREGATLFMTVLACFQILLHRYTGQFDIAVGSPIAGRTRAEIEQLIGFFVNTLVLRTDLSGNPTFAELLSRVRNTVLDAFEHQELPFEKLVEELNPERSRSRAPLFQVMFALQNVPWQQLEMAGLVAAPVEVESSTVKFDLYVALIERNQELSLRIEYSTDLFDAATIRRMASHFQTLLENVAAGSDRRIAELRIVTDDERQQSIGAWNDTKRDYPRHKSIPELFAEQVNRHPDAVAVIFQDQKTNYLELDRKSNQIAHYLNAIGVGPGTLVAICVERSLSMVAGLLGILKAGGAYVPLDPTYPKERLAFMLRDTGASVVLTEKALAENLPENLARVIRLDQDWREIAAQREEKLESHVTSEALAYIMYTSGSTGTSKGVAVSHRAINRLVMNSDYVQLGSADVVAQASNISFDAVTFEIWGALLNGAQLALLAKNTLLSPEALSTAIDKFAVTTLFLTTALFNQMVEQIPFALGRLHYLLFGGEMADAQRVRELLAKGPPKSLLHVYGPTESTTFTSWYPVTAVGEVASSVPIGRPIANTSIYILDAYQEPVPIGVSGEIYIGGDGLALGYWNRPELSVEKFIANPFGTEAGARLYRTGDLARYLPDGNIEFIGRLDNQVKIRGHRIELGEIEAVLNQHSKVRDAVVLAREDIPGDKRLVAYIVAVAGSTILSEDLRGFLREKLPEFMIPAKFLLIDALLLTPNGKIDREALPNAGPVDIGSDHRYVEPRTATEQAFAEIWAKILNVERVGIHDNFFDLGGHSLMSVRLVAEIESSLGKRVPIAALFASPTIAQLTSQLDFLPQELPSPVVAVQPKGSKPPFFCVHVGYRAYNYLSGYFGADQPFYGLGQHFAGNRVTDPRVENLARQSLKDVYALQPRGPYYITGHSFGGLIAYEMAQQLQSDGKEVAFLGLIDTAYPKRRKSITRRIVSGVVDYYESLSQLSGWAKVRYILRRTRISFQWLVGAMRCYAYQVIDKPLPPDLVPFYIEHIVFRSKYPKQQARYRPRRYRGPVHFFKARDSSSDIETWQALLNENLILHEIPGTHLSIINEPDVVELGRTLKECLEHAVRNSDKVRSQGGLGIDSLHVPSATREQSGDGVIGAGGGT